MIKRLLKSLQRWLAYTFLFAVILVGSIAILLNTTAGSRFVVNRAIAYVPGSLYVDGIDGTLWRRLEIRVLRYRNEQIEIDGDNVELAINWPRLVAGSIALRSVAVAAIDMRRLAPPADEPQPLSIGMPDLPFAVSVTNGAVDNFVLQRPSGDFLLSDINWNRLQIGGQRIQALTTSFVLSRIRFDVADLDTTLAGDVPVVANFRWSIGENSWAGQGDVSGTLAEASVSHSLTEELAIETTGIVRLQHQLEPVYELTSRIAAYQAGSFVLENSEVRTVGTIENFDAEFQSTVSEPRIPVSSVSGYADGSLSGLANGNYRIENEYFSAQANGSIAWQPGLDIALDVVAERFDPSFIDERFAGNLTGSLRVAAGDPGDWQISDAQITGMLSEYAVSASGTISSDGQQVLCSGCLATVAQDAEPAMRLAAGIEGSDTSFDVEINGSYGNISDLSAAGRLQRSPDGVSGTFSRIAFDESNTGRWVLGTPLALRTGESRVDIDAHRWVPPQGTLDINRIAWSPESASIIGNASLLPLAIANRFLPEGLRLEGTAAAQVDVARNGDEWSGTAHWQQTGTVLHMDQLGDVQYALAIPQAEADGTFGGDTAHIESTLRIDPGVSILTTATINNLADNPQLDAEMAVRGDQWDWLTALFPEIDGLGGEITADVTATGDVTAPRLGGSATWKDGSANIPALNVPLRDIDLRIETTTDDAADLEARAIAGEGPIVLAGSIDNIFSAEPGFRFTLSGETAELINWPEYHLWASPDLEVSGSLLGWDARGTLAIPRAEIDVRALPENAVAISEDVRIATVDYSTSMSRARYSGEARILLGDAVHVAAFGLDTRLEGELLVRKNPDRELSLEGTVRLVDGEFEAYGQRLAIEAGTLTFTGPLDDPIVDVRATRTIEDFDSTVVAGIHLTGRAKQINSTVYAEPAMREADALSYLMIGRPLSEASTAEGDLLSNAAIGLGLRRAARITQQVGQSLGLDELTIVGSGGDATALVAGKQINSRLYARYAYGVFSRLGMIMIRYKLSQRLSLEAGAGETQSIDILYTVEKE